MAGDRKVSESPTSAPHHAPPERPSLREIARVFLFLGFTAFGGPAAHIAMMREQIVRRRGWLSEERFVDLIGIVNLIPGPSSTELGIYLGYLRAGWAGLIVAGVCFIGPAMLIVLALAWGYVTFGALPAVSGVVRGITPVVIAIIAQALWGLGRTVLRGPIPILAGVGVLSLYLLGWNTVLLLFGAAALAGLALLISESRRGSSTLLLSGVFGAIAPGFSLIALFLTFLKIGAVTYGSGYVLLAFLHGDLVTHLRWLTNHQLLDAVSVGQFTPGPVFTTATFIGYVVGGLPGALVATVGIFLPAFVLIPIIDPLARQVRRRRITAHLLDGVNAAALGLMGGVLVQLGQNALSGIVPILEAIFALALLLRFRLNSAWLILAGATIGFLVYGLQ
jgi:chromate transporter